MLKSISFAGAAMALVLSSAPSYAKELKSIGVSLGSLGNPFFNALAKGAEAKAKQNEDLYKSALQAAQQAHRNYAKRQMTWFRREPDVVWMGGFGDDPQVQQNCISIVAAKSSDTTGLKKGAVTNGASRG